MNLFHNEISQITSMFLTFFNNIFSLLNRFFVIEFNGVSIGYGWLIVGFLVLGLLISVFWKGGKT